MQASQIVKEPISAIVPTIGRPDSLARLLRSLAAQTHRVDEVVIADGSSDNQTAKVISDPTWVDAGLVVRRVPVFPPHAVRQRQAAIAASVGELLLMLDDDVELEPMCVSEMVRALTSQSDVVGVMADFNNQAWAMPTRVWRAYLRTVHGMQAGEWQGRVVGPLLRFGFNPVPREETACDWLGSGNSLIRRDAFERAGGFSDFFLHRSTMNEDVDLGLRLAREGKILFCPAARLGHFHDPGGRVSPKQAAEDDIFNRFHVLQKSAGRSRSSALRSVSLFWLIESASAISGSLIRRREIGRAFARALGGFVGLLRALRSRSLRTSRAVP
jgi:GT2 family glycosyltransferase